MKLNLPVNDNVLDLPFGFTMPGIRPGDIKRANVIEEYATDERGKPFCVVRLQIEFSDAGAQHVVQNMLKEELKAVGRGGVN